MLTLFFHFTKSTADGMDLFSGTRTSKVRVNRVLVTAKGVIATAVLGHGQGSREPNCTENGESFGRVC